MKVPKVNLSRKIRKLSPQKSFRTLDQRISKLQDELLNIEVLSVQAIYGIKINKDNYKKYKLG